jgi:hypothetical protein
MPVVLIETAVKFSIPVATEANAGQAMLEAPMMKLTCSPVFEATFTPGELSNTIVLTFLLNIQKQKIY